MTPEELAYIRQGAELSNFLPILEREVEKMQSALDARVYLQLQNGGLTPEVALAAWIERKTNAALVKRLRSWVQLGESVGRRNAAELNIPNLETKYYEDLPLPQ